MEWRYATPLGRVVQLYDWRGSHRDRVHGAVVAVRDVERVVGADRDGTDAANILICSDLPDHSVRCGVDDRDRLSVRCGDVNPLAVGTGRDVPRAGSDGDCGDLSIVGRARWTGDVDHRHHVVGA